MLSIRTLLCCSVVSVVTACSGSGNSIRPSTSSEQSPTNDTDNVASEIAAPVTDSVTTEVTAPDSVLVNQLNLDTGFYKQHLDVNGMAIVASDRVSPYALLESRWVIGNMLVNRPDLLPVIASTNTRLTVMAIDEFTTDVPEHSDLTPANFRDRRARGLGATSQRPVVSAGEENVLQLPGDPYSTESILIHEFAHVVHQQGMNTLDNNFQSTLDSYYRLAIDEGLWQGTYAATNSSEYFAEGVQSWFGTNRENDNEHNEINTREELVAYDLRLAGLLEQVFGDNPWQYEGPRDRQTEREHLEGFDVRAAGEFVWPDRLANIDVSDGPRGDPDVRRLPNLLEEDWSNIVSPSSPSGASTIYFYNDTASFVNVRWIDFDGQRVDYSNLLLAPDTYSSSSSFEGHLFEAVTADEGVVVAQFRVEAQTGIATID
ncbi:MAG: hypothetical protein AB8B97_27220 [Granulosicoccus sp.]